MIPTLEVKVIPSKDRVYLGDELQLQCQVSGDPSARVEWKSLSQNGPFPDNVVVRGNILVVNGVNSENGGIYRYIHLFYFIFQINSYLSQRCSVDTYAGAFNSDYVLAIQG